jgi:copper oxidase (laccase) domain-containing protein
MALQRICDTNVTSHIPDLKNSRQPVVRQLQPPRRASFIISQVHCYQTINYTEVPTGKGTSSTRLWWYPHPHR